VLPRETMTRVLEIIRRDVSASEVRVDNPTQNLESYFLEVVERAKRAVQETSGAQSGAKVAAFLRPSPEAEGTGHTRILERLTVPKAEPVTPAPVEEAKPAVDEKKLESLTKAEPTPVAKPSPAAEEKPVDLSKADEKLSSLLNRSK